MTATELVDRLVEDLEKIIRAKSIARSQAQLHTDRMNYGTDFK